ncbi:MAG TPA: CDP-glycerol glycerophosphotransferase family protein [Verrucomicrobiae bacterium]
MPASPEATAERNLTNAIAAQPPAIRGHNFDRLKTIFIVVDSGISIRNILRTDVYKVLRACKNLRIVIFSSLTDDDFYKEVGGENVFFEPLQNWKATPLVKSLRSFRKDLWSEKHNVMRFREKRAARKGRFSRELFYNLFFRGNGGRLERGMERVARLEEKFTPTLAKEFYAKYKPDLVFYTTINSKDLSVEIAAKQHGVKSCAFILSWDNPTTKGPFVVRPDRAIVWNQIMRDELSVLHDFPSEKILMSGPPQFDIYTDHSPYASRDQFFKKWDLDLNKRLITYTTGSRGMLPLEHETVEMLYQKVKDGAFREPVQLLVRLHPKDNFEPYDQFKGKAGIVIQTPGRRGNTNDSWNPTRSDMYELAETMKYSDVVVNIASTTTIDAACFDTPVVNVAFDGPRNVPYEESCKRYYKFDHYKKVVETGGITIANTIDELVQQIERYLDDPSLEAEGRARIREEQCYKLDGRSGERIGQYLIELLKAEKL